MKKKITIVLSSLVFASTFAFSSSAYYEEIDYFSDSSYSTIVGQKSVHCSGPVVNVGVRTQYYRVVAKGSCSTHSGPD
jgi:hypothetical protein